MTPQAGYNIAVRHLREEEASHRAHAGKKALEALVYYADEKRCEADRREALLALGRAEGISAAIAEMENHIDWPAKTEAA